MRSWAQISAVLYGGNKASSRASMTRSMERTGSDLAPRGFTTLFVFFLFLGGIQLLCLSIIGSYLAHIYDEVKRRPPYIVESILNPPKGAEKEPPPSAKP